VDVPAQLAARARLLNTGHARKTDPIDAAAVAMVAQHHRRLHPVRAEDDSLVLRLLSERRDDLAGERTRTANRLHALLRDLIPGGAKRNLSADQAAARPPRFARVSGSRRDGPLPRTGSRRLDPAAWERVVWISGGTQIGYLPEIARDALDGNPVE
jgi:transposase